MDVLIKYSKQLRNDLSKIRNETFTDIKRINLDCGTLPLLRNGQDYRLHPGLKPFFKPLINIKSPVIYWFKIQSPHAAKDLHTKIQTLKLDINRNVPAFKKGFNFWDSKILYVGKTKRDIHGRMYVHLGYYKNINTQGLQLCHWSKNLKLKLQLNYIVLPKELEDLTGLFENELAKHLHPIFGKHK